ncbi:MAG: damage-inducible protein DinB [Proteobacteria bacterium]|nr:MAG: damage-inducible protein DinB [Pseudomonadota bacterium]
MQTFFRELFDYTHHCNEQSNTFLIELGDRLPAKCAQLQSHIFNAHQIWNSRIRPGKKPFGVWDSHPVDQWEAINTENYQKTLDILARVNLEEVIVYRNSRGDEFSKVVKDMLFHVVNHSTYHRGQVALLLRQHEIDPVASDYIFYKR